MGKAAIRGYRFSRHNAFSKGKGKEEATSPPKKEANPASLRSAAPSKGRGSRGHSLLPMEGGAPKERKLDGGSGMKKSGEDRLKYAVCESTLSTATRSPFPNGEGCDTRIPLSPSRQSEYMHVWKNNTHGKAFPAWGRLRYENTAIPEIKPSPGGKAKRRWLRRTKRKPTPPRCARQPLPREGARVDTPSFLWKEVPRRGGGWMGKAV